MRRHFFSLIALAACLLGTSVAVSQAHYKAGDPNSPDGWYFDGASTSGARDALKDPINFIFYGGTADQSAYTRDRIEQHMADDWDGNDVGSSPWRKSNAIISFCKVNQRVYWPGDGSNITSDKTDWHGSTSPTSVCTSQTHARFWDDHEHAKVTSGHGALNQWAIGGIHHEHPVGKRKCLKPLVGPKVCTFVGTTHRIDRDWDAVRYQMVKAMHAHCATAAWKYHPGAHGTFGCGVYGACFDNSGYIARFSLHHASDGGCAGY